MRNRFLLWLIGWAALVFSFVAVGRVAMAAPAVDRSTPRQTVRGFLRAMGEGDALAARKYLDRRKGPPGGIKWTEVAERLEIALELRMVLDLDAISDVPEGTKDDGEDVERIGTIESEQGEIPVTLRKIGSTAKPIWVFSSETLQALPPINAPPSSVSGLVELVPEPWRDRRYAGLWSWQWLGLSLALLVALPLGYAAGRILTKVASGLASRTPGDWDDALVHETKGGVRFVVAWLAFAVSIEALALPAVVMQWAEIVARSPLILAAGWMTRAAVRAITNVYLERTHDDVELQQRGLRTQLNILRRLSTLVIVLITGSLILMQFEVVRNVGLSLLASAGVAGVALGFAAKESLANVIAGLQLAMAQTLRLGDVVVVEGNWATVEEIALTYVRLRLFDDRRLVIPVSKLLSSSFENWSAAHDGLIGIVELAVDPSTPIDIVREEVERLATAHENHDGRDLRVQLIDVDEHRALLRARVSSADLGSTFQMRCDIREGLLKFLQELGGGRYIARQRFERIEPKPDRGPA